MKPFSGERTQKSRFHDLIADMVRDALNELLALAFERPKNRSALILIEGHTQHSGVIGHYRKNIVSGGTDDTESARRAHAHDLGPSV
jgi:hypothetical protein